MATQGSITTAPLPCGCGLTVYLCIFSPSRNGKAQGANLGLGVLIGQTQIRQPTLNILLICSLKCKHVMTIFCNFPHTFAIVKRILQRLVQAEERRVDNLLNFPADG